MNQDEEPEKQAEYQSFLLRLWKDGEHEGKWRSSLQSPLTGERKGFASLDELVEYLRKITASFSIEGPK